MFNIKNKAKKGDTFDFNISIGVSKKRAAEIVNAFGHAKLDTNSWKDLIPLVKERAKIKGDAEMIYIGYVFGRMYEKEHNPVFEMMDKMIKDLPKHKHAH